MIATIHKVVHGIPEDDPRNPATIADNVGDNVGDVAGMGSDLFGSFAESSCATLVIATQIDDLRNSGWGTLCFPLCVSALGVVVGVLASMTVERVYPVMRKESIERCLSLHIATSTAIMIPFTFILSVLVLPETFNINGISSKSFVASNIDGNQCTTTTPKYHSVCLCYEYHSFISVRKSDSRNSRGSSHWQLRRVLYQQFEFACAQFGQGIYYRPRNNHYQWVSFRLRECTRTHNYLSCCDLHLLQPL